TNEMTFDSTDVPAPLVSLYVTTSTLTINQHLTIADLNLRLNISFPDDEDLDFLLRSPSGTEVELYSPLGYPNPFRPDFDNTVFDDQASTPISEGSPPYSGSYQPESPLSALNGQDAFGTWELEITDLPWSGFFNDGWLNTWSVTIQP